MNKSLSLLLTVVILSLVSFSGSVLADDDNEIEGYVLSLEENAFILSTKYGENVRVPFKDDIIIKDKHNIGIKPGAKVEVKLDRAGKLYKIEVEGYREEKKITPPLTITETQTPLLKSVSIQVEQKESIKVNVVQNNGHVLVPIKEVVEYLDGNLIWYPKSQIIEVMKGNDQLLFRINKLAMYKNLQKLSIPQAPILKDGVAYIPITVLSKALGYKLNLDAANQSFVITQ